MTEARAKGRAGAGEPRKTAARSAPREGPVDKPRATLRIIETRVYRGPNYWSYDPTI